MAESTLVHTRAPHACVQCKSKKLRCEPSKESPSVCRRCYRLNKDCIPAEVKVRKTKSKAVRTRLDRLEQTYGGIMELLSDRRKSGPSQTPAVARISPELVAYLAPATPASSSDATPQSESCWAGHPQPPISFASAENLVEHYRCSLQEHLPLVPLPQNLNVAYLQKESPCLLLAVLTVSSWKQRALQLRLEKRFMQDFAARYFERGEKSLDMLQALIVYICWIHFASTSLSSNAYRLVSSAVTLIVDLGIDKPPASIVDQERRQKTHPIRDPQSSRFWSVGARRALVGVYLLAVTCHISLRKDTTMRYSEYIEECALSLAELSETPFDSSWIHFVRLSRIGAEIRDTLTWHQDTPYCTSEEEMKILVKSFEQKLSAWHASIPVVIEKHATVRIAYSIRHASMYEVGMHGIVEGQPLSPTRITLLFKCVNSIRQIVLTTLSLPLTAIEAWSAINWRHLKYAVMLGSKVAMTLDSVACDTESATRVLQLDNTLEQLSTRVADLLVMSNNSPGQTHYYQQLFLEWEQMRKLYQPAKERLTNSMTYVGISGADMGETAFVQRYDYLQPVPAPVMDNDGSMPAMHWNFLENMNDWTLEDFWLTPENCDAGGYIPA